MTRLGAITAISIMMVNVIKECGDDRRMVLR